MSCVSLGEVRGVTAKDRRGIPPLVSRGSVPVSPQCPPGVGIEAVIYPSYHWELSLSRSLRVHILGGVAP